MGRFNTLVTIPLDFLEFTKLGKCFMDDLGWIAPDPQMTLYEWIGCLQRYIIIKFAWQLIESLQVEKNSMPHTYAMSIPFCWMAILRYLYRYWKSVKDYKKRTWTMICFHRWSTEVCHKECVALSIDLLPISVCPSYTFHRQIECLKFVRAE